MVVKFREKRIRLMRNDFDNAHINKILDLYCNTRSMYLEENLSYQIGKGKSKYIQAKDFYQKKNKDGKRPDKYLSTTVLYNHLHGKQNIGVYATNKSDRNKVSKSKFILFDIDTNDCAREDCELLIEILETHFSVPSEYINVNFSGSKGYHVTIFFDDLIDMDTLRRFYNDVLMTTGLKEHEVEFYPENKGVKLPFAIHPDTDNRAWFVDKETFRQIDDFDYIFDIKKLDSNFLNRYRSYVLYYNEEYEVDVHRAENNGSKRTDEEIEIDNKRIKRLLDTKILQEVGTRNDMTLLTAIHLRHIGYTEHDTTELLTDIMINTKKKLPSHIDTPMSQIESKTAYIVGTVYKNDYKKPIINKTDCLKWNKKEIEDVLSVDDYHLKKLYYILLQHGKIYGNKIDNQFYMTYEQMAERGADSKRSRVLSQINQLKALGKIRIIRQNEFDKQTYHDTKGKISKSLPNIYQIKANKNPTIGSCEIQNGKNIIFDNWLWYLHKNDFINLKDYVSAPKYREIRRANF